MFYQQAVGFFVGGVDFFPFLPPPPPKTKGSQQRQQEAPAPQAGTVGG